MVAGTVAADANANAHTNINTNTGTYTVSHAFAVAHRTASVADGDSNPVPDINPEAHGDSIANTYSVRGAWQKRRAYRRACVITCSAFSGARSSVPSTTVSVGHQCGASGTNRNSVWPAS